MICPPPVYGVSGSWFLTSAAAVEPDFQAESQCLGSHKGKTWFKITPQPWTSPGTALVEKGVWEIGTKPSALLPYWIKCSNRKFAPFGVKVFMMLLCGCGGSGRVITLAEETGEGLFLNPLAFVLKFATNYRKSPPQASIWLLMGTCHTHFSKLLLIFSGL